MKKIIAIIVVLLLLALPSFLPMPLVTSGFVAQYALGEGMKFDLAAWNLSPLPREIKSDDATHIILKVDGMPIASTPTSAPSKIGQFARLEQTVEYRISKNEVTTPGFDTATGSIELPAGKHTISVEWLGASSWGSQVRIVQL